MEASRCGKNVRELPRECQGWSDVARARSELNLVSYVSRDRDSVACSSEVIEKYTIKLEMSTNRLRVILSTYH